MKAMYWMERKENQTEPPQIVEEAIHRELEKKGLEMPPVQEAWFAGNKTGGQVSSERFPGAYRIWYWEV